jgi:putative addiction module component (TIGR02574 family)
MTNEMTQEFLKLSIAERIQLVEDIWDSVAKESAQVPVSESQLAEIERRLARFSENPGDTRPWEEVRKDLLSR